MWLILKGIDGVMDGLELIPAAILIFRLDLTSSPKIHDLSRQSYGWGAWSVLDGFA